MLAVQTMVTRRTADGRVLGADQRLTVAQALEVYTAGSAHSTGESLLKGRLAPGMLADSGIPDYRARTGCGGGIPRPRSS